MRILIVNVSLRPESKQKYFPIGLGYITTAIKNHGYDFEILDMDVNNYSEDYIEQYLKNNRFDVVCMGSIVTGYKYIKRFASMVKSANSHTKVVVGNTVASSIPEILLSKTEADIAVIGEGDVTIIELLDRLKDSDDIEGVKGIYYKENGTIKKTPPREPIKNLDDLPILEWDLFDMEFYIKATSNAVNEPLPLNIKEIRAFTVNTARGCPFICTFCYHAFWGVKYRFRSPQSIVQEIRLLKQKYDVNFIIFHDDLTFPNKRHAREVVQHLKEEDLNIFWCATLRSNFFKNEEDIELAKQFKEAGCTGVAYSLENANPQILKWMNKKATAEDFSRQCDILNRAGLASWTSLVFGYPIETKETIKQTIDYCIKNGIYPSAGYLLPQPKTPIYEYAIQHGFIKDEEEYLLGLGDRQDLRLNMTKMSDKEFEETVQENLERCNTELKLNLEKTSLIKTGYYRGKKRGEYDQRQ